MLQFHLLTRLVPICTGRVEAKSPSIFRPSRSPRSNLHGACGGKELGGQVSKVSVPFQSARGVWRQRMRQGQARPHLSCSNLHGACGGKALSGIHIMRPPRVPICTGRVEAKGDALHTHPARQVPICTGRVEAKRQKRTATRRKGGSNLHGACGGKGTDIKDADYIESRSNLHGACGGKGRMCTSAAARGTLQSARGVWRQRQDCGCHKMAYCRCNLHGTCRETERHHPSPEKNPRKFMQTYCIFIHLAV